MNNMTGPHLQSPWPMTVVCRVYVLALLLGIGAPMIADAMSNGDEPSVLVSWTPEKVDPVNFFFVSLTITVPHQDITVGPLNITDDHFDGLRIAGAYDRREEMPGDAYRLYYSIRLQPLPGASRFRMAPMALEWRDTNAHAANQHGAHLLLPVRYFDRLPIHHPAPAGIEPPRRPWPVLTIARIIWMLGYGFVMVALIGWAIRCLRHRRGPLPRPPRQEALAELQALLDRRRPEQNMHREFSEELNQIVRRFTERHWQILIPNPTSREFLQTVQGDSRISEDWIEALRRFLDQSDTIKYAARPPDRQEVEQAALSAQSLIETADTPAASSPGEGQSEPKPDKTGGNHVATR